MVSIIIPVYNGERFLRRCVDSVTGQAGEELEILLVNDGSTDGTAALCRALAGSDPRIRVITQENRGVSAARNAGLDRAEGEYVTFVDADDALLPGGLKALRTALEGASAQMALGRLIRSREEPFLCGEGVLEGEAFLRAVLEDRPVGYYACRVLYRRDFIGTLRFAEGRVTGEDSFFVFQCALKQPRVVLADQAVYRYYRNPEGASRSGITEKKCGDVLHFLEEKGKLLAGGYPHLMGLYPNLIVKTHMMLLRNFCRTKGWRQRERESLRAVFRNRRGYVPLSREEKRWFFLLTHHLYYPAKLWNLLRKKIRK